MTDLHDAVQLLHARLVDNLSLPEELVLVGGSTAGVDVRIFRELNGRTRRRACAVCRLTLPREVPWTIRAGEDDPELHQ